MPVLPEYIPLARQKDTRAASWRGSPNRAPAQPSLPTAGEKENASAQIKPQRSRRGRARGKAPPLPPQPDLDDFFVNCVLPPGVALAALRAELSAHGASPLRAYEIGSPRVLLQRRNGAASGSPHAEPSAAPTRPSSVELTPFRTPLAAAAAAGGAGGAAGGPGGPGAAGEDGEEFPGAPLPDLALPPSVPSEILQKGHLLSLLFAESAEAEKVSELLQKKWPQATVMVVSRNRAVLNASLVLKGLPSLAKTERMIAELEKAMPHKPSYIRLHRGERGVFKNVVFLKYPNREIAEESKLRLERFVIGSRLLKVEFKKKEKGTAERERGTTLQQLVRDLRLSNEHEGFTYQRTALTKDELKLLKQLTQSYGLSFDLTGQTVTVKRILPASGRPSPALQPTATSLANLAPTAATPGALRPMDFKGIRHWKEMRSHSHGLGIARPKGPGDVPPFAPGRGRPI